MPLRALVTAHAQSAWNRSTRQLTKAGRNFAVAVVATVWIFAAGGTALSLGAAGWFLGSQAGPAGVSWAGAVLVALSLGLGTLFGLTGGGRLLEAGQLRGFPVRPLTLLGAELFARFVEPITAAVALCLSAFSGGLALGRPELVPRLVVLLPVLLVVLVSMQFILSELFAAVAKRARLAMSLLLILAMGLSPRFLDSLRPQDAPAQERLLALKALMDVLPPVRLLVSPGWKAGLLWSLANGALAALLLAIGSWVMAREAVDSPAVAIGREKGLWTFRRPALGVARLHLATLFRTPVGRYSLIAPLFAMVLVPWFTELVFGWQRAALAVFSYAALGGVQFHFNAFGFDGPALAELFRLPVPSRTLWVGKQLAVAAVVLAEGALLTLFLRVIRDEALGECMSGLAIFVAIHALMGAVGRWVSTLWPRTLPRSGMRGASAPLPVVLVNLFGTFGIVGGLVGSQAAVQSAAPHWALPFALGVAGVSLAVSVATLGPATGFLESRREQVLGALK